MQTFYKIKIMEEKYIYIVYVANVDTGYFSSFYETKESNSVEDIVAIFRDEEKAKEYCEDSKTLAYKAVLSDL